MQIFSTEDKIVLPASVEEVVGAAAVESRSEEVEQDVLPQCFQPAVPSVDEILDVVVLVVQNTELLQARDDRPQDSRHLRNAAHAAGLPQREQR